MKFNLISCARVHAHVLLETHKKTKQMQLARGLANTKLSDWDSIL